MAATALLTSVATLLPSTGAGAWTTTLTFCWFLFLDFWEDLFLLTLPDAAFDLEDSLAVGTFYAKLRRSNGVSFLT